MVIKNQTSPADKIRLPFPSGIYHPSLAPTQKQREQMLEGKDAWGKAHLETIWARYEYTPGPDATEYDGPRTPYGDPDFVCYKRWEVARARAIASASPSIGAAPTPMLTEDGHYTTEYFTYCVQVLRFVCEFGERVEEGTERDYFSCIESTIETRQAFAMASKALKTVTDVFKHTRWEDEQDARKRLHANTKSLPALLGAMEEKPAAEAQTIANVKEVLS